MTARTQLYVPGATPERFDRAVASGAGAVLLDLEDAVAEPAKDAAREAVTDWLRSRPGGGPEIWVRVNTGGRGDDDVRAVVTSGLTGIVVPKAERPDDLARLGELIGAVEDAAGMRPGSVAVSPLVESAAALLAAAALATASRVTHLQLGEADLAADLGVDPDDEDSQLLFARSTVVTASAAAGLQPPLGPVSTDFRDLDMLATGSERLRRLGFAGRACIHPRQVPVVEEVFRPSPVAVAAARDVLDRLAAAGDGVALDAGGRMIDEARARQARRLLSAAGEGAR